MIEIYCTLSGRAINTNPGKSIPRNGFAGGGAVHFGGAPAAVYWRILMHLNRLLLL